MCADFPEIASLHTTPNFCTPHLIFCTRYLINLHTTPIFCTQHLIHKLSIWQTSDESDCSIPDSWCQPLFRLSFAHGTQTPSQSQPSIQHMHTVYHTGLVLSLYQSSSQQDMQIVYLSVPGNREEKRYKCLQCEKKQYYRLKHMKLRHSYFECGVCNQTVKEGN